MVTNCGALRTNHDASPWLTRSVASGNASARARIRSNGVIDSRPAGIRCRNTCQSILPPRDSPRHSGAVRMTFTRSRLEFDDVTVGAGAFDCRLGPFRTDQVVIGTGDYVHRTPP